MEKHTARPKREKYSVSHYFINLTKNYLIFIIHNTPIGLKTFSKQDEEKVLSMKNAFSLRILHIKK